jgi:phosphate transport system permease protein
VAIAVWLSEYGRPAALARAVESGIEIVAGTPSIVLAIFGLLLFSQGAFSFLSFTAEGGAVFGRSFLTAGAMMSLIALPLVVGSTREALQSIPEHVREASYALGKDRASTIRRVLLPGSRSGIGTGVTLGMGRIIGDTAIVVILLGATLTLDKESNAPILGTLKGTGSTLTSYVYNNSPAGEGGAPQKAYAAAAVLLLLVIAMNLFVDVISRRRRPAWTSR